MLQAHELATRIEDDADGVEAELVRVGTLCPLAQPLPGDLAHLRPLVRSHPLQGHGARTGEPRLDLAEHQRPAVERDEVELAPARTVVALDDVEAAPGQMLGRELLAELTEAVAKVAAHPVDATRRRVTRG